jgi:hypothetical protein
VTISHGCGKGFLAEFDWTGTCARRRRSIFINGEAAGR